MLPSVGRYGRAALHLDPVEAAIVEGRWRAPRASDVVKSYEGKECKWATTTPNADGQFDQRGMQGGYLYCRYECERNVVALLEAAGHGMVYVNGDPRVGDLYSTGYVRLPIALRAGDNELLFHCPRGPVRVRIRAAKAAGILNLGDVTAPDRLIGESEPAWAGIVVVNATTEFVTGWRLELEAAGTRSATPVPAMLPLSVRKVAVKLPGNGPFQAGKQSIEVILRAEGGEELDRDRFDIAVKQATEAHKRTFISEIDDSVQYYAVQPMRSPLDKDSRVTARQGVAEPESGGTAARPALFLSLHGASVEAMSQAAAYAPKSWGVVVAPTNRRPYGFDWEDWGRWDAIEVLLLARGRYDVDPTRIYLTGHSMGGHGTWHVGATFPSLFAAIGPSAGWASFMSYSGAPRYDNAVGVDAILRRAAAASDTVSLARNYAGQGVYVLHGDADDNVPVQQARDMRNVLGEFHQDLRWHEQTGAGHWWDASDEPGSDCVDWGPMFDFFARRARAMPWQVRELDFTTVSPGVSSACDWVIIEAQDRSMILSRARLRCDPVGRRILGTTENVARMTLYTVALQGTGAVQLEIDGTKLTVGAAATSAASPTTATSQAANGNGGWVQGLPDAATSWKDRGQIHLQRAGGNWRVVDSFAPEDKCPWRCGPFKDAFRNHVLFVYGTNGDEPENAWALAKARYDAEQFWYRGNGSITVMSDREFGASAETAPAWTDRSVVLYGNRETNRAWGQVLTSGPVDVGRGRVKIGERAWEGGEYGCLFIRPRKGSERGSVAAVGGSGVVGMRLTDRMPYFVSGVGYPDCIVLTPAALRDGAKGVAAAGFFAVDWGVEGGEFAWGER